MFRNIKALQMAGRHAHDAIDAPAPAPVRRVQWARTRAGSDDHNGTKPLKHFHFI